jgi:hypothetical protein
MLQKFKITTCAFILCLFGLTLMTVTPVFATESGAFLRCSNMAAGDIGQIKEMMRCFKALALDSDGRKGPAYKQCAKMKGKSGGLAAITDKSNCFREIAFQRTHQNMERQTYALSYKHNCVFNIQSTSDEFSRNAVPFEEAKARCDAA